jgi:hypothetical protein
VVTIDELVKEIFPKDKVRYINIDIEELEDEAIEGAVEKLNTLRPNLQIELFGDDGIDCTCGLLEDFGYRVFFL